MSSILRKTETAIHEHGGKQWKGRDACCPQIFFNAVELELSGSSLPERFFYGLLKRRSFQNHNCI
jgi:hypothetical protein